MNRVYNFAAGPACMPEPVLKRAAEEMLDYGGSGTSVMEMSHRSAVFEGIISEARSKFRALIGIPDNYKVLFLQGGASGQFAAVPLNLMRNMKADYVLSGQFSKKAYDEARKYGDIKVLATSEDENFSYIPRFSPGQARPDADYVHICYNNTIFGTRFFGAPDTGNIPLVADISSYILSEPFDVTKFGLVYAGAQKNMAPAGMAVVIVREDLLGYARDICPVVLNYKIQADNDSMYNTPPCYQIYILKLVVEWIESLGGLSAMKARNIKKAAILYDYLDSSELFIPTAKKEHRSLMNVTFKCGDDALDKAFCARAEAAGFVNIAGHRSVGGMRASIYNAMPEEGVSKLVEFMRDFEKKNA